MESATIHPPSKHIKTNTGKQVHHLPEEIIEEILPNLPVKSLLRFKCVSKSWRSLISSKQFIKTHLENSKKNKTFAYHSIVSTSSVPSSNLWTIKACSLSSLIEPITRALPIDYSFLMNYSRHILFVGSCNGLVCVLVDRSRFFVLNPSTRESKELPDFFSGLKFDAEKGWGLFSSYGFGFDESSGDYKIYVVYTTTGSCTPYIARLYSLKADSWRKVAFFHDGSLSQSSGRFVSGKLHWGGGRGSEWEIVCLDLKSEDMGHVKHPITCLNDKIYPELGVLDGCLCVYYDYDITKLDIWIWKEYGVEDSWSKFFTIPYLSKYWNPSYTTWSSHTIPLLVLSNDEVLFAYGSVFYVYNMEKHSVRQWDTLHSYGKCVHEVEVYIESLISLCSRR